MFKYSIGPVGAALLSLFTIPIMAWVFNAEDIGKYNLYIVSTSFAMMFLTMGLHQSLVREFNESVNIESLLKSIFVPILILQISSNFIFFLLYCSDFDLSFILFGTVDLQLSLLISTSFFIITFNCIISHLVRMQERPLLFSFIQFAPKATLFILIAISYAYNGDLDYKYLVFSYLSSILCVFIGLVLFYKRLLIRVIFSEFNKEIMAKCLRFATPLMFGGVAYWSMTAIDRALLRYFSGFSELGVYALSISLASFTTIFTAVFSSIWHPIVYKWGVGKKSIVKVQAVTDYLFLFVIFIWSLGVITSIFLPFLFPAEFSDIQFLFVACLAMPLLFLLSEATVVGIGLSKRTIFSMYTSLIGFAINIVLNLVLIPVINAKGAAIASCISFFIFFILRTEFSCIAWYSLKRIKMYSFITLYIVFTVIYILFENVSSIIITSWFICCCYVVFFIVKGFLS